MKIEDCLILAVPMTYFAMYAVERRYPAREFPRIRWWSFIGAGCMALMLSASVIVPLLLPIDWLGSRRLMDGTRLGIVGGVIVGFVVIEFAIYGYHRACHNFQFMWRAFHQMHHSAERLDMPGSVLFHPFELIAQVIIAVGVNVFALGLDPIAAALAGYLVTFCALFQHWNIRTPRWIGYVIQRPEAHCIHHAFNIHAYNYADLPLVDMVFGTFKNPTTFEGRVGFERPPAFGKMLIGIDISRGQVTRQPDFQATDAVSIR